MAQQAASPQAALQALQVAPQAASPRAALKALQVAPRAESSMSAAPQAALPMVAASE